jgi:hypothetical protein
VATGQSLGSHALSGIFRLKEVSTVTKTTIRIRGVVALSMLILLLFMVTTGSILLVAQRGGVMPLPLWNFATRAHPVGGFLFLALGIGHAALNWKLFESDLRALREKKR